MPKKSSATPTKKSTKELTPAQAYYKHVYEDAPKKVGRPKKILSKSEFMKKYDERRSFVSVSNNGESGRYINNNPRAAAIKAAKPLLTKNKKTANVTVRESTRGSKKKEFSYTVKKENVTMDDKDAKQLEKKIGFVPKFKYSAKKKK